MTNIEPQKVFVKYIPIDTTIDEIRVFFSVCGKVLNVHLVSPKSDQAYSRTYTIGFITYETQAEADRAVVELNNKQMKFGYSLSVVHSLQYEPKRKEPDNHSKEQEKKVAQSKEYQDMLWRCKANAEKINKIYNKPEEEREIEELKTKKRDLQAKQLKLKKTNNILKEEINILSMQVKIKKLEMENMKLKEAQ